MSLKIFFLILVIVCLKNPILFAAPTCSLKFEILKLLHEPEERKKFEKELKPNEFKNFNLFKQALSKIHDDAVLKELTAEEMKKFQFFNVPLKSMGEEVNQLQVVASKEITWPSIWKIKVYFEFFSNEAEKVGLKFPKQILVLVHDQHFNYLGPHFINETYGPGFQKIVMQKVPQIEKNFEQAAIYAHEWGHWLTEINDLNLFLNRSPGQRKLLSVLSEALADISAFSYTNFDKISFLRDPIKRSFIYLDSNAPIEVSAISTKFTFKTLTLDPWFPSMTSTTSASVVSDDRLAFIRYISKILEERGTQPLSLYLTELAAQKMSSHKSVAERLKRFKSLLQAFNIELDSLAKLADAKNLSDGEKFTLFIEKCRKIIESVN